jgi:hypothetical protein
MKKQNKEFLGVDDALKAYGGFARFYAADVPVEAVASMAPKGFRRVLCCCEGGDFALTFMGLGKPGTEIFAFDNCPAQLFLLAAKAKLIEDPKTDHFNPSMDSIIQLYEGRIQPLPRIIKKLNTHAKVVNIKTGQYVNLPGETAEKFGVDFFPGNDSGETRTKVFWARNQRFLSGVRKNIPGLRFVHQDILFLSDLFKPSSLDVIFISDIHIPAIMPYYIGRLKLLVSCLKPGGVVIGDVEDHRNLENLPTVIEVLGHDLQMFDLKKRGQKGSILAFQKQ